MFCIFASKLKGEMRMDTIMTWAKENYDLISFIVGAVGIVVACLSLIYELKRRKRKKGQHME